MINNFDIISQMSNQSSVGKLAEHKTNDSLANYMLQEKDSPSSFASLLGKELQNVHSAEKSAKADSAHSNQATDKKPQQQEKVSNTKEENAQEKLARHNKTDEKNKTDKSKKPLSNEKVASQDSTKTKNNQDEKSKEVSANEKKASALEARNPKESLQASLQTPNQKEKNDSAIDNKKSDKKIDTRSKKNKSSLKEGLAKAFSNIKDPNTKQVTVATTKETTTFKSHFQKASATLKMLELANTKEEKGLLANNKALAKIIHDVSALKQSVKTANEILDGKAVLQSKMVAEALEQGEKNPNKKARNIERQVANKETSSLLPNEASKNIVSRETFQPKQQGENLNQQNQKNIFSKSLAKSQATDKAEGTVARSNMQAGFGENLMEKTTPQMQRGQVDFRSPVMKQQFQAMMQRARLNVKENGNARFSTSMYPADLGKVAVHLSMTDGIVFGRFTVESDMVKSQLAEYLAQLSENLREDGLDVGGFEVDVRDQSSNQELDDEGSLRAGVKKNILNNFENQQKTNTTGEEGVYA